MKTRLVQRLAIVSAAALLSLSGTAALAQPGPHGPHGGDFSFGIAALKDQLNLNTSQQTMWDSAVAQTNATAMKSSERFVFMVVTFQLFS